MKPFNNSEVWFVTGSQHLYGPETLKLVGEHSQKIADALNKSESIPVKVVFKPVVKTPEEIYNTCFGIMFFRLSSPIDPVTITCD